MNILFFGDQWDNLWRRRQQLAWRLAQSDVVEHVVYVERPLPVTSFLKFLMGLADRDGKDRWRRVLSNCSRMMAVGEKLSVVTTFAPLPVVGLEWFFRVSERARDRWLLHWLKKHFGMERLLVWVSYPQHSTNVVRALKPRLLWYDCTEDFSAVPKMPDCVRAQIQTTDRWLTKHADVVTAVSRILYEEKLGVNPNTHWLPNAVDTDLFLHPPESFVVPSELENLPRPVLAFVGGLNDWAHDWSLLDQVARLRPDWIFLLIGELSVSPATKGMLRNHANILCVGQKTYHELPAYLIHSDVCFQFYRPIRSNDTGNSQKLFLYLAAGKPVVSTPSADVDAYIDLVSIVNSADEFVQETEKALSSNDDSLIRRRQTFAQQNSWAARTESILRILRDASRTI